jgi:putative colanic acid biosynthesis acetyltransferase WcaF
MPLDIAANRQARKYSSKEMLRRLLWSFGYLLFRFSPRPCFGWRRLILRCFGAKVGAHVNTYGSTRVYFPWNLSVGAWTAIGENVLIYNLGPITIGQTVTISHGAHLCAGTHDYRDPLMPLLKPPIRIEDQAWICADAFVGPDVVVGEGAVVGARAVAMKDVAPWTVVAGNPARFVRKRTLTTHL